MTALLLKNRALKDTEKNIKFYFTRLSDEDVDAEKRKALIRDSEADLFVEISAQSSENSADNGVTCFYNDSYFLGKLTNAQFADIIEKKLVTKTGAYARGIFPSEDDELIDASTIPSVKVSLGYMTGDTDAARLSDNSYRTRLAEGLYEGIAEAFEVME